MTKFLISKINMAEGGDLTADSRVTGAPGKHPLISISTTLNCLSDHYQKKNMLMLNIMFQRTYMLRERAHFTLGLVLLIVSGDSLAVLREHELSNC